MRVYNREEGGASNPTVATGCSAPGGKVALEADRQGQRSAVEDAIPDASVGVKPLESGHCMTSATTMKIFCGAYSRSSSWAFGSRPL